MLHKGGDGMLTDAQCSVLSTILSGDVTNVSRLGAFGIESLMFVYLKLSSSSVDEVKG